MNIQRIGVIADKTEKAVQALAELKARYGVVDLTGVKAPNVEVIVVLGGDGFMLHSLHQFMEFNIPFYGMNCGTVGFLMNNYLQDRLHERLHTAKMETVHPLCMTAINHKGGKYSALAINEVSLLRQTNQAAHIRIYVDGALRMDEMICDGVLVATCAGSSAYNVSAGGPIIPLGSNILALTPISPFRPRRWKGALLPHTATIRFEVADHEKRAVSAVSDYFEVRDVVSVEVQEERNKTLRLLFDSHHSLEERIIREQFVP